ncbi:MAG: ATP-dependent DNA helicase [Flavobacteriales bacterium]|nr:ATP-dependent DNA helicase [Flavobacteriales bacterium]|tara:strand:- start:9130 stop:11376 length:2247 start_codon:yes stop_codon:yes gene_type:complete
MAYTLNNEQLSAVQNTEGPVIIIAGPGSGKTRVVTERIAHLINSGTSGQNILALTFTNKAANEMKKRVHSITNNQDAFSIWMGTFHSIFAKILRKEAIKIGYTNNFTIYDNEDSIKTIRRIIDNKNLDKEIYNPKYIFSKISFLKNHLISDTKYFEQIDLIKNDKINNQEEFKNIYQQYVKICQTSNAMDFDDLLIKTYDLFKHHVETLKKYQTLFQYILIDEYQDTNKVQDAIVKQLSKKHQNICIVGDDSQSIYSFRGANINNMLQFKNYFKTVKEFKLEQNYRSTKNIVKVANILIEKNKNKINKRIFTNQEEGEKIKLFEYYNDREEGDKTAEKIQESIYKNKTNRDEYAILYRTNSQSKAVEDGLRKRGISYKIFGGLSFYQRKEIKDILAYLKLITNHHDDTALLRIINYPSRGIGLTTVEKLNEIANKEQTSIWSILNSEKIDQLKINSSTKNKLHNFKNLICDFHTKINEDLFTTSQFIVKKTQIIDKLKENLNEENINRLENISELFNTIKFFSIKETNNSITDFINEISLDENHDQKEINNTEHVSLMTLHQSKGLEFKYVYILGVENGLFPSQKKTKHQTDIEEERRLFYVGITRAIKNVCISYALNRFKFGTVINSSKSCFIEEIEHLLNIDNITKYNTTYKNQSLLNKNKHYINKQKNKSSLDYNPLKKLKKISSDIYRDKRLLKIGQKIKHNIFGIGEITNIDLSDGNEKIKVIFQNSGEKILLTKFAKFEIIE